MFDFKDLPTPDSAENHDAYVKRCAVDLHALGKGASVRRLVETCESGWSEHRRGFAERQPGQ